ncbi:DNA-binding protein [Cryobacterium sp. TmT2-59]|uniref:DNA-binding protein n=1 Tax=Cryobacterium shii TaxID=1259235 RepID=A0AAQ2HFF8_9MICO|nr:MULTISPECIES: helix-turn-helix domain-containing protein [Cryobacterium]TFC44894.1 DNA-binding protein [Cryobacterium shii]TFC82129.1 DNA-binding protein [Cryobacterium sp. TmT2-59]
MTTNRPRVLDDALANELFLIPDEVSAELRVSRGDLKRLRDTGLGPAYFTISSTIRYLQTDVDQWRAEHPRGIEIPHRRS